jgi:hypothetical protein
MNYISIKGGKKSQQDKITSMVEFCIKKLMPRMNSLNIDIKVTSITGDAEGYCLRESNRDFEIEVDSSLTLRKMLETVAHEMVHVKQYARREMNDWSYKEDKYYKWKDQFVPTNTDYWDLPWEIEANGREVGLFVRWAEKEGYAKHKWTHI